VLHEPRDPRLTAIFRATVRVADGSGVVIRNGKTVLVATAAHVVRDSEAHMVWKGTVFGDCPVIARDDNLDIAVLTSPVKLEEVALDVADEQADTLPGDPVWAAGFPQGWNGSDPVIVSGTVAGIGKENWLNLDGTWGNSGGPICRLLEDRPIVAGIVQGNASEASRGLDLFDQLTKGMSERLAAVSDSMEAPSTSDLKFMRGTMGLLASHMKVSEMLGSLVRNHYRTGFVKFGPVADLRKLLGTGGGHRS
jgi:S1-C subfamily serine protease